MRLQDALAEAISSDARDEIVAAAIAREGLEAVPTLPAQMAEFLRGPIADELSSRLGAERAAELSATFARLLGLEAEAAVPLDSGVRPRRGHSMAPPNPEAPTIVVASPDLSQVDRLIEQLQGRARVVAAYDALALLSALQRHPEPMVVALDAAMPDVEGAVRETIFRLLGAQTALLEPPRFEAEAILASCVAALDEAEALTKSSADEPITARIPRPEVAPRTVLVAHPSGAWRDNLGRVLRRAGWRPVPAPDGLMALDACLAEHPVAAIVSLELPTFPGRALIELLAKRMGAAAPTVIAIAEPGAAVPSGCLAAFSEEEPRDVLASLQARFGDAD